MIKYYDLTGYHIRANDNLYADIVSVLNRKGVPHYAFFDENGNIMCKKAPYPSSGKELAELFEKHIEQIS